MHRTENHSSFEFCRLHLICNPAFWSNITEKHKARPDFQIFKQIRRTVAALTPTLIDQSTNNSTAMPHMTLIAYLIIPASDTLQQISTIESTTLLFDVLHAWIRRWLATIRQRTRRLTSFEANNVFYIKIRWGEMQYKKIESI